MAFATTNVQGGSAVGPLKFYCGDWSGLPGDASGTVTLGGGRCYMAEFRNGDSDNPKEVPEVDISESSGTITLTVHNHMNVTNGRFLVIYS